VAWRECLVHQGEGFLAFDRGALARKPLGIQRHLLRRAIAAHRPGLRDIDFVAIERALAFIRNPTRTRQRDLVAGLRLSVEGEHLWLAGWGADLPGDEWPQVAENEVIPLEIPGSLRLEGGWRLRAGLVELSAETMAQVFSNEDPFQAWLDLGKIEAPLIVRTRQPGDRFQPLGMGGQEVRLAEFMLNHKLPRRARAGWPLVCCGEAIAWVAGLRMDERFCLRPESQSAIYLSMERL
jgi:tRNA(Ile)-lysidine synthase